MSDIKNKYLIDAVLLPHTEELFKVFSNKTPDEITLKLVTNELMDKLHLSIDAVKALLAVRQQQCGAFVEAMMMLFGLSSSKPTTYLIATTGDTNGCQQVITEIRLPDTTDITLTVHIGYLGVNQPQETNDAAFIRIRDHVIAALPDIEVIGINPVTEGIFKPNTPELIDAYFQHIEDTTEHVYLMTNTPGGGTFVGKSYQQFLWHNCHAFQFVVRFNFNPDIVKLKAHAPIQDNVVSLK